MVSQEVAQQPEAVPSAVAGVPMTFAHESAMLEHTQLPPALPSVLAGTEARQGQAMTPDGDARLSFLAQGFQSRLAEFALVVGIYKADHGAADSAGVQRFLCTVLARWCEHTKWRATRRMPLQPQLSAGQAPGADWSPSRGHSEEEPSWPTRGAQTGPA